MFESDNTRSNLLKITVGYTLFIAVSYLIHTLVSHSSFVMLFQALNLIILMGVGLYFFKKNGAPAIDQSIKNRNDLMQKLRNQADTWNSKRHLAEQDTTAQNELMVVLTDKVARWHDASVRQAEERKAEEERLRTALQEKRKVQAYYATLARARQEIVVHSVERAREQLHKQFVDDVHGDQFLRTILEYMKKNTQGDRHE